MDDPIVSRGTLWEILRTVENPPELRQQVTKCGVLEAEATAQPLGVRENQQPRP